jgi:chromatin structure-remodeling complex subunit RSC9
VQGAVNKFIIKGIRPRHAPIDAKGRTYSRCLWKEAGHKQCGEFQLKPRHMFEHIAAAHLGMKRKADGDWSFESNSLAYQPQDCSWGNCGHFSKIGHSAPSLYDLGRHVKTHLPDTSAKASARLKYNRTLANKTRTLGFSDADTLDYDPEQGSEATFKETWFQDTTKDERGVATGLSLTSGLLLRNIARNIPRAVNLMDGTDKDRLRTQLMEQLLAPSKDRLLFSMAHNRPLGPLMADIVAWIERGTK